MAADSGTRVIGGVIFEVEALKLLAAEEAMAGDRVNDFAVAVAQPLAKLQEASPAEASVHKELLASETVPALNARTSVALQVDPKRQVHASGRPSGRLTA